ncbi:uncharacterized protein [Haliotis asinina]|uniref:uncharacterized protein n=1 Tax=Haliotis asinina TaxID=109174 RepID=UPI003531A726
MKPALLVSIIICLVIPAVLAVKLSLGATGARGNHAIRHRSNAVTGKTVLLRNGEYLSFYLCLRQDTSLRISNVRYSNDGGPDLVSLTIDHVDVGSFLTGNKSDWGKLWNVFHISGPVGTPWVFREGMHVLSLLAKAANGIEIDYVELELSDQTITLDILTCALVCSNVLPTVPPVNPNVLENATLLQTSYPTKCAEEDNVKIPVFLRNVMSYKLTATMPDYKTFINDRQPNTTGCVSLPSVYWKISHFVIPQPLSRATFPEVRVDFLFGRNKPFTSQVLQFVFRLKGQSQGYIDAEIGSKVTIKIQPVKSKVTMRVLYQGRVKKVMGLVDEVFKPGETTKEWHIPDFSWTEFDENVLLVSIATSEISSLTFDYVQLERRYMRPDRPFSIFRSENLIIEGIDVDFWWRSPETMKVHRLDTGDVFNKVDYFRISRPVPWSKGFAQIFVLYQDGNIRLLELPPPGLDWIPFGTSVIVGQSDAETLRPSSPIVRMDLAPTNLTMTLYYADGGSARLDLKAAIPETSLTVSNLVFKKDTTRYPFATFRSMHVKDGNCDSDSVMVDGERAYHVTHGWTSLTGKSFLLFRRCQSKHLTLSPDIRLDIEQTTSSQTSQIMNSQLWAEFVEWRRIMGFH